MLQIPRWRVFTLNESSEGNRCVNRHLQERMINAPIDKYPRRLCALFESFCSRISQILSDPGSVICYSFEPYGIAIIVDKNGWIMAISYGSI